MIGDAFSVFGEFLQNFSPSYRKEQQQQRSLAELAQVATGQNIPNFRRNELGNPAAINQEMQRNLSAAMIRNPATAETSLAALLDTPERQMARQQLALQQQNAAQEQAMRQQTLALQRQQEERLAEKDRRGNIPDGYRLNAKGEAELIPGIKPMGLFKPEEQFKMAETTLGNYRKDVEPLNSIIGTINNAREVAAQDTGAASFQLAKLAIQAYDKRASAVTDQEMQEIIKSGGLKSRFGNAFDLYVEGKKFSDEQKKEILKTLNPLARGALKQKAALDQGYTKLTEPYGIDFKTIQGAYNLDEVAEPVISNVTTSQPNGMPGRVIDFNSLPKD